MSDQIQVQETTGEIVPVHGHRVGCQGVGGVLGHPLVWIEIGASHRAACLYCDRQFVHVGEGVGVPALPVGVQVIADHH